MCGFTGVSLVSFLFVYYNQSVFFLLIFLCMLCFSPEPETPVTFTLPLHDTTTSEEGSFTLECHTSKSPKEILWAKDEQLLTPSEKVEILAEGTVHTLTVKDVTLEDEGLYTAKVGDQVTSARLNVEGSVNKRIN